MIEDLAEEEDINGIIQLLTPLEQSGMVVKRNREQLLLDIENFYVIRREQQVIACAALFTSKDNKTAELACLAVSPTYQHSGRAGKLFQFICAQANNKQLQSIYVLTTQTSHWFKERGFIKSEAQKLPEEKQRLINQDRTSEGYLYQL